MDALTTLRRRCTAALLTLAFAGASAQHPVIQRLERAFADGPSAPVEHALDSLLSVPGQPVDLRFEAWMLMAECAYRSVNSVRFQAFTDSAAALTHPKDHASQARVELNRCRHAALLIHPHRAYRHGMAAFAHYRRVPDRAAWRYAYFVHQTMGTMYRNWPVSPDSIFNHFDTAQAMLARRHDVLPYWHAHLHKAISNAALDRCGPQNPERARYSPLCDREQRASLAILERHHPGQAAERGLMENLRGLYHIYSDRPDSAWHWYRKAEDRAVAGGLTDELHAIWLVSLRWQSYVIELPPRRNDIDLLRSFGSKLLEAQHRMAVYAAPRTSAGGLFYHDTYWYSPFAASMALHARLWEITRDTAHLDRALWVAEKARRDAWNIAQDLRSRPELRLPDPPEGMLQAVQQRLDDDEAVLVYVQDDLAGRMTRNLVLAVTRDAFAVHFADPQLNARAGSSIAHGDMLSYRRAYHALHQQLYAPIADLLQDARRVRVFPSGAMAYVAFDALLADTLGTDLADCHPLVQRHAFSQPLWLLPPERADREGMGRTHYLAPVPGPGVLTDLKRMRVTMRRWGTHAAVDSTGRWNALAGAIPTSDVLYLAGHGAGVTGLDMQPRHYFGADTTGRAAWMSPSDLMPLDLHARLVVHLACQSGLFETDPSSGAFSFARAFLFAGARSVLSTAVLADEGAAIRLVALFREELAAGHPTDVALQRAKLAYLQRYRLPEEQLPIHWAGWQIHGEGVAVEAPNSWWPWLLGMAVLVGLAVVWGWGRRSP